MSAYRDDLCHAVGTGPFSGLCGAEQVWTSSWGADLTCHACMRMVAAEPLRLLDTPEGATTPQRMGALQEARLVWSRLFTAGATDGIRCPGRRDVQIGGSR